MNNSEPSTLTAISPIDGRYWSKLQNLSKYFSEFGLIRGRVKVEVEYFIRLCEIPLPMLAEFDHSHIQTLRDIADRFSHEDAEKIKDTEKVTNHDVKAVEYFVKEKGEAVPDWHKFKEFVHFGLTSQDINNTAIPYLLKQAIEESYLPKLNELIEKIRVMAVEYKDVALLAKTHGQAATPTRMGKELFVFVERLIRQRETLRKTDITAKFGGATGQFNAHFIALPKIDWPGFSDKFIKDVFGLTREQFTTQISHYDQFGAVFDVMKRIDTIVIDFCRDMWMYISMDYFKLKVKEGEIGSSAMPHKVNPIDFENAEGNCGIAVALFDHLANKLPISRLQRDLSDSTVLRNIGVPIAHSYLAFVYLLSGLGKLSLNKQKIDEDLNANIIVLSEAIQTVLRREGFDNPYELLKEHTRGKQVTAETIKTVIDHLEVPQHIKDELHQITPFNFIGVLPADSSFFAESLNLTTDKDLFYS